MGDNMTNEPKTDEPKAVLLYKGQPTGERIDKLEASLSRIEAALECQKKPPAPTTAPQTSGPSPLVAALAPPAAAPPNLGGLDLPTILGLAKGFMGGGSEASDTINIKDMYASIGERVFFRVIDRMLPSGRDIRKEGNPHDHRRA